MKIINQGAEHHFLAFIEKLRNNSSGWIACTFGFSKNMNHEEIVSRRAFMTETLAKLRAESTDFLDKIVEQGFDMSHASVFQFKDNDIILLCCPQNEEEQKNVRDTLEHITRGLPKSFCDYGFLTKELPVFQKIADQKMLNMKKIQAYEMLGDNNQIESIALRRKKRDEPIVLVVEDDRFTASYINGFLKEYDVVVARNGEDAIMKYIEYAPDAVFLDLHLPGINGHQVLEGIKAADDEAFVVMLSVDTAQSNIMHASESGATSYLKKPFSRERVLNTLRLSPFIRYSRGILPFEHHEAL